MEKKERKTRTIIHWEMAFARVLTECFDACIDLNNLCIDTSEQDAETTKKAILTVLNCICQEVAKTISKKQATRDIIALKSQVQLMKIPNKAGIVEALDEFISLYE